MDKTKNPELLQIAQRGLEFESVFQTLVRAELMEGFELKHITQINGSLSIQFMHKVTRSMLLEVKEAVDKQHVFRVNIVVGVRYLTPENSAEDKSSELLAQIEATYAVDYRVQNPDLLNNQDALDEFALHNVSYHLWPFWREFAMAQTQRMNLPPVALPMRLPT